MLAAPKSLPRRGGRAAPGRARELYPPQVFGFCPSQEGLGSSVLVSEKRNPRRPSNPSSFRVQNLSSSSRLSTSRMPSLKVDSDFCTLSANRRLGPERRAVPCIGTGRQRLPLNRDAAKFLRRL